MANGFVCWNAEGEDDPGENPKRRNVVLDCLSIEGAAEQYADRIWADNDSPDEMTLMVRDPDGRVHKVSVQAEPTITFSASVVDP